MSSLQGKKARLKYDFEPEYDDELEVYCDDVVKIISGPFDDGWTLVENQKRKGLVPTDYLEFLNEMKARRKAPEIPVTKPRISTVMKKVKTEVVDEQDIERLRRQILYKERMKRFRGFLGGKRFQNQRRRISLIQEVISTEERYLEGLKMCIRIFKRNFELSKNKFLREKEQSVFGNMEEIAKLNQELLTSLKEAYSTYPVVHIGQCFKKYAHKMVIYAEYCINYDKNYETYQKWVSSNRKFNSFINKIYSKHQSDLKGQLLDSFLILPVQRIPRYRMLLQDILKVTPKDHIEFTDISDALRDIEQVADYMNEEKRSVEQSQQLIELKETLKDLTNMSNLIGVHRKCVKEGTLTVHCPERRLKGTYFAYLLTDVLIFLDSKKRPGTIVFILMYVSSISYVQNTLNFRIDTFHKDAALTIECSTETKTNAKDWVSKMETSIGYCNNLYSRNGVSENMRQICIDRTNCHTAIRNILENYARFVQSSQDLKGNIRDLRKSIKKKEEELAKLQNELDHEKELRAIEEQKLAKYEKTKGEMQHLVMENLSAAQERDQIVKKTLPDPIETLPILFNEVETTVPLMNWK